MEPPSRWPWPIAAVLAVLLVLALGNGLALFRLGRQVDEMADALDGTEAPEAATWAAGLGGTPATVTPVEGAAEGAPLRLADKPRPQGDTLVLRRNRPPRHLNPTLTSSADVADITGLVLGTLLELDPDNPGGVLPGLAISWETSATGATYHLRQGVQSPMAGHSARRMSSTPGGCSPTRRCTPSAGGGASKT